MMFKDFKVFVFMMIDKFVGSKDIFEQMGFLGQFKFNGLMMYLFIE